MITTPRPTRQVVPRPTYEVVRRHPSTARKTLRTLRAHFRDPLLRRRGETRRLTRLAEELETVALPALEEAARELGYPVPLEHGSHARRYACLMTDFPAVKYRRPTPRVNGVAKAEADSGTVEARVRLGLSGLLVRRPGLRELALPELLDEATRWGV